MGINELTLLVGQLRECDGHIVKQLIGVLTRYLERQGRLASKEWENCQQKVIGLLGRADMFQLRRVYTILLVMLGGELD